MQQSVVAVRERSSGAPSSLPAPQPNPKPHLLWIDDEISRSHVEVRFLELEGFRVDCALTGTDGLSLARTRQYHGILLDLRLPDLPGLAVLATLRDENITTPVLVLTGFGDFESARVAGRFGANEFKAKPVFTDDLEVIVKRLVQAPPAANPTAGELQIGLGGLARLLEVLHVLMRELQPDVEVTSAPEANQILKAALIRTLTNPALPMPVFMACASALRCVAASDEHKSGLDLASNMESLILEAFGRRDPQDSRVIRALEMLRSAAALRKRLEIEKIAKSQGIDDAHLGRLIKTETGFKFTDWRTASLLRPSLRPLADTDEHVKQIGHQLGYKYEPQFDRDFHEFFGVTPKQFRQFCRQRE